MRRDRFVSAGVGVAALAAACLCSSADAGTIVPGQYKLSNHPDGNAAPPTYGLRLDGLTDGNASSIFTFDFDHALSNMLMDYDGNTIHIHGTAFGGLDTGNGYDAGMSGVVEIDFTYAVGVGMVPGDDDIWVTGNSMNNSGSLEMISGFGDHNGATLFDLVDKSNGTYIFRFGDHNDDNGHRGFAGLSGWGWLNHAAADGSIGDINTHLAASDWLFTAQLVPVPPAVWLGAAGILGIAAKRRRKKTA